MKKPPYPMPTEKRAKQFMPFAALTGLAEALEAKEHVTVPRILLSDEMAEELDRKMHLPRLLSALSRSSKSFSFP